MEEQIPTDLIIRYLSNEATTEEAESLLNWIASDSSHQKIFAEWVQNWKQEIPVNDSFDVQNGLRILNDRIDHHEKDMHKKSASFSWISIAASVLILISSTVFLIKIPVNNNSDTAEYTEYKTAAGKLASIILNDSSKVTLNANSILKVPTKFTKDKREVILEGEAFFEIKKDHGHPFLVHTGKLTTKVLGTSFNVQTLPEKITVSVATGKVMVSNGTSETFILPKEKITYAEETNTIIKGAADLESILAWRNQELIFHDTPLSEVAVLLEKKYRLTITFEKVTLKKCLITGKFKNQSLDEILEAISYSMGLTFQKTGSEIKFSGNGCDL